MSKREQLLQIMRDALESTKKRLDEKGVAGFLRRT